MKNVNFFLRVNFSRLIMLTALCTLLTGRSFSQTILSQGDVAIVGFQAYSDGSNPRSFSFVTWKPLQTGTVIRFSDNGFNYSTLSAAASGNYRNAEQTLSWTATAPVDSGTVVRIVGVTPSIGSAVCVNANGTAATSLGLTLSTGDQIIVFQADALPLSGPSSTLTGGTLIYLFSFSGPGSSVTGFLSGSATTDSFTSHVPSDMSASNTFFANQYNGGQYNGARSGATALSLYKPYVRSMSDWSFSNSSVITYNVTSFTINPPAVAPSITSQPSASTICAGGNTSFTVGANDATGYQWYVNPGTGYTPITNGGVYSGATTNTLNITGATAGMNGYAYRVVVTGTGSPDATSNSVALTVNSPASIGTSPSGSTICAGGNTSFTVGASNVTSFQWYVNSGSGYTAITNGGIYSGATSATLNITGATSGMNGYQYRVVVSGLCTPSSTTSTSASLTVNSAPSITQNPIAATVCDGGNFIMYVAASNATGYQWQVNDGGGYVNLSDGTGLGGATYSGVNTSVISVSNAGTSMSGYAFRAIVSGNCTPNATSSGAALTVSPNVTYYEDYDEDGYGNPGVTTVSCTGAPAGFVANNTDCNDDDAAVHAAPAITGQPSSSTICAGNNTTFVVTATSGTSYQWQVDNGGGFVNISNGGTYSNATTSALTITGATAGMNGYNYRLVVSNSCSPAAVSNAATLTINSAPAITLNPTAQSVCEGSTATFTSTASNATGYQWYVNTGSGFSAVSNGTGSAGEVYSGATSATLTISNTAASMSTVYSYRVIASGLCTPDATSATAAITVLANVTYYADADSDGYGNPSVTTVSCTGAPVGYVANSLDCNDNNNTVYPGAPEICHDGLDNNCDGTVDEGCPLTQVVATTCGTTLATIGTTIFANNVTGATEYRFRVTNGANVQTIDRTSRSFSLTSLTVSYGTAYTIDVAYKKNGFWTAFGPSCVVTTPPAPQTQIQASQCGTTVPSFGTTIYANSLVGATAYRFRVTEGGNTEVIENASRAFTLSQLSSYGYGRVYSVEVSGNTESGWTTYGPVCTITAPAAVTKIRAAQCGVTLASASTTISADNIAGATQYRFRIVNGGNTQTIDKTVNSFNMTELASFEYGTTYTVDVQVEYDGSFGAYGAACSITTPSLNLGIQASQCGTTLAALSTTIYANSVPGATQYRFRVINGANVQTIDRTSRTFTLTQLASYAYSTTYTIDVAVELNGSWTAYGSACNVTSPDASTKVRSSQCGTTVADISTLVYADEVTGATAYRFRFVEGGNTYTYTSATRTVTLSDIPYAYGTTYAVDVAVEVNGLFGAYGTVCNISTPPAVSQVQASQCGTTLSALNTAIYANNFSAATQYRFRVVNGANVQTIDRTTRTFTLTQLPVFAYATTYTIDVALYVNGSWTAYGPACTVTSPEPLTQLQASNCGAVVAPTASISANTVVNATAYRFRFTEGANVQTVESSTRAILLSSVPSIVPGTLYLVDVSAYYNGQWQDYGSVCNLTISGGAPAKAGVATEELAAEGSSFDVVTFPNPFTSEFGLKVSTENTASVNVTVYDMSGKVLTSATVAPQEISSLRMGEEFAAGIYQVKVVQGTETKTLKVVKQ